MNPLEQLNGYLRRVEARLRMSLFWRGAALVAATALTATLLLVLAANAFAFADGVVGASRVLLFLALVLVAAMGLLWPLLRLNRAQAARRAERAFPQLEQRLLTFAERPNDADPFVQLLAADALDSLPETEPRRLAPTARIVALASAAAASIGALLWLVLAGPGFLGYGAALLWAGPAKTQFYAIVVTPGNVTLRRKADQVITARLVGFEAHDVRLRARYRNTAKWEELPMQPQSGGYHFLFAGIPEALDYYVDAAGVHSKTYTISVKDLPGVKRLRVTYHYPRWTGLADAVQEPGGDLHGVEGTEADIAVTTDRPLARGALVLDSGERVPLANGAARLTIRKDGVYHVAAIDQGEAVRISEDYFIEARKDTPPVVRITRPGRDARVSPIEEVSIAATASDDFGLQDFTLHYSVNGGPEKTMPLLKEPNARQAEGSATLPLEDFHLAPGDLVSLYASARDAHETVKTDMYFVQAEPFERAYSQSQQMGGDGAGGDMDQQNQTSERQKEIIAATWNQLRDKPDRKSAEENARFLSGVQAKLRDQAKSMARRMGSRELTGTNEDFQSFSRNMEQAAEAMGTAAEKLKKMEWQAALPEEQKSLQHLLRAEATMRDIQVAFGRRGGGGGGGGGRNSQGRDLQNLFDLELDTEKNQYETGRQSAASPQNRDADEAARRLEQLARRQQELANEQSRQQPSFQQRWQQEVLRREAEELARQMRASGDQASRRAAEELSRAAEEMRRAGGQGGAEARRAADRLAKALENLRGAARQQASSELDNLTRRADSLGAQQREYINKLRQQLGAQEQQQQPPSLRRPQPGGDTEQLARSRDQQIEELQKLERDMQDAVRNLAGAEPGASDKLRQALSNMQQQELRTRMKYNADLMRRGLGAYTVMREAPVTQALDDLRQDLRNAQQALGREPGKGREGELERALAQVEQLRRELENAQQRGQQGQQGQPGQPGQQQGQQGDSPQGGPGPAWGDDRGGNFGRWYGGTTGPYWIGSLTRLRQALQNYPELARKIQGAQAGQLLDRLQQVELELRRKLDDTRQVRSGASEPVPPGYADAVAEYYRRLSKR